MVFFILHNYHTFDNVSQQKAVMIFKNECNEFTLIIMSEASAVGMSGSHVPSAYYLFSKTTRQLDLVPQLFEFGTTEFVVFASAQPVKYGQVLPASDR